MSSIFNFREKEKIDTFFWLVCGSGPFCFSFSCLFFPVGSTQKQYDYSFLSFVIFLALVFYFFGPNIQFRQKILFPAILDENQIKPENIIDYE